uniref:WH2 domain-containing protein n=1 Tax=Mola mola TaxID=94237 RepID=A0A3Q3WH65_MOLML
SLALIGAGPPSGPPPTCSPPSGPPQLSRDKSKGRSALLLDICNGTRLKKAAVVNDPCLFVFCSDERSSSAASCREVNCEGYITFTRTPPFCVTSPSASSSVTPSTPSPRSQPIG